MDLRLSDSGGELDYQGHIVGLDLCLMCGLVAYCCAATIASVGDHISFFGVGVCSDGAEYATAGVCSVTGVNVHVKGAKAEGAVIS